MKFTRFRLVQNSGLLYGSPAYSFMLVATENIQAFRAFLKAKNVLLPPQKAAFDRHHDKTVFSEQIGSSSAQQALKISDAHD